MSKVVIDIENCVRCEEGHWSITFKKFEKFPVMHGEEDYWWWGICPKLNEPIIMKVSEC